MTDQMNLLDWQPSPARSTDPETSHMAAERAALKASPRRLMVLRHLAFEPMTDFELAAATGVQPTSIGKRRGEAVQAGWARVSKDSAGKKVTRPSPTNSPALVWEITAAGLAILSGERNASHQ